MNQSTNQPINPLSSFDVRLLVPADAGALSGLLVGDSDEYRQHFHPFASLAASELSLMLQTSEKDRYWGVWDGEDLVAFFMLRGFDQGYERPSFGVYVAECMAGKGLASMSLDYSLDWCQKHGIVDVMLKVHPENKRAKAVYESAGFREEGGCPDTGHTVMCRTTTDDG